MFNYASNIGFNIGLTDHEENDQQARMNKVKAEFTAKIDGLKQDKLRIVSDKENLSAEIKKCQQKTLSFQNQIKEYEGKITEYTNAIKLFEDNQKIRSQQLNDLQSKLYQTSKNYDEELKDDGDYQKKIQSQNQLISALVNQIESWKLNSANGSNRISELQNAIAQKSAEIDKIRMEIQAVGKKIEEYQQNTKNFDVEIEQINDEYAKVVNERDNVSFQYQLKLNQINEIEAKINNLNNRISTVSKSTEEYKKRIKSYEDKELELKASTSEIELKINAVKKESLERDSKIAMLNEYINKREEHIQNLITACKEKEGIIKSCAEESTKNSQKVYELRRLLEEKCNEIQKWDEENIRDDSKIKELLLMIQFQSNTIKHWEEENARDDSQIASLETEITATDQRISTVRDILMQIRTKYDELTQCTYGLSIATNNETTVISQSIEANVEKYKKMAEEEKTKDATIANLSNVINILRGKVAELLKQKYDLLSEIEKLKTFITFERYKTDVLVSKSGEYDQRIKTEVMTKEENSKMYSQCNVTIKGHKDDMLAREKEIIEIFDDIEKTW